MSTLAVERTSLEMEIILCEACDLHTTRTQAVPGTGPMPAPLMIVGEGPGADEDVRGEPFIGRAGQLLTAMLHAVHIDRRRVFITNVVKCRPPENRKPQPEEAEACAPYLARQIALVDPAILVTLGRPAAEMILGTDVPRLSDIHGQWQTLGERLVYPMYHPAHLLRNPSAKPAAWADLKILAARLKALALFTAVAEPEGAQPA